MNEKKTFSAIIIATLLILGGSVIVFSNNSTAAVINASQNVKIETPEVSYDWKDIQYSGPKATKTFKIKNNGTENLRLGKVQTSCTCTTAQVVIEGQKSPLFKMHAGSSWVGEGAPSEEAELESVFDQTFHGPTGVGPIERFITVETNSKDSPKLEFSLKGNVVK